MDQIPQHILTRQTATRMNAKNAQTIKENIKDKKRWKDKGAKDSKSESEEKSSR